MRLEFQFVGFQPRQPFRDKANTMISELSELMPSDSHCSARCVMIDNKFFFQVMFVSRTECFIAKDVLDPRNENIDSRAWQAVAIDRLHGSLMNQIESWRGTRAA